MLDNLSVYQLLGRLMDKHFMVVSLTMLFESGGSAHKKPIYWLDFEEILVVFSILFFVFNNDAELLPSLVRSDTIIA